MYYCKGNYEALSHPQKPADVDKKSAYLVGGGLASLAAACFLIRDGQMKGEHIHILEELDIPGGACDGINDHEKGFIIRGGREFDTHYECFWNLFSSIPSIETEGASVLDEFYWLDKKDPNISLNRVIQNRGESYNLNGEYGLNDKAKMELTKLFLTRDEDLYDRRINEVLSQDFFDSNFWLIWRTMFAFEEWHSALEMKLYVQRFIHHIGGLLDFSAVRFSKYNQYESFILPMLKYLEAHGVDFQYNTTVTNVIFDIQKDKKVAKKIICTHNGKEESIDLIEDDLVFITNGSCTENSTLGDDTHAAEFNDSIGGCWQLWRNIAEQDPSFGHPDKFCTNTKESNWQSATVTTLDNRIPPYIEKLCKRDPFSGKVVTGGIITIKDSKWLMSFTLNRQPHFRDQPKDQLVVWVYSLFTDVPGDYIKKPMKDCTGMEITQEWLYHLGVPENEIYDMAKNSAHCIPCIMPYITAFFSPRAKGDRPNVIPDGSVNFAFLGQFAETPRDTVFTIEYSVRTAMEAVYTLLNIDKGVPEVIGSCYDIRVLLNAMSTLSDGKKITEMNFPLKEIAVSTLPDSEKITEMNLLFKEQLMSRENLMMVQGTVIGELLKRYNLI